MKFDVPFDVMFVIVLYFPEMSEFDGSGCSLFAS